MLYCPIHGEVTRTTFLSACFNAGCQSHFFNPKSMIDRCTDPVTPTWRPCHPILRLSSRPSNLVSLTPRFCLTQSDPRLPRQKNHPCEINRRECNQRCHNPCSPSYSRPHHVQSNADQGSDYLWQQQFKGFQFTHKFQRKHLCGSKDAASEDHPWEKI